MDLIGFVEDPVYRGAARAGRIVPGIPGGSRADVRVVETTYGSGGPGRVGDTSA